MPGESEEISRQTGGRGSDERELRLDDVIYSGSWVECHSNWWAKLAVCNFCILNWLDITSMTILI